MALPRARVLYTDVDGTLVGPGGNLLRASDGTPTLEPAAAIVRAQHAGIEIVPMSGRDRPQMIELGRLLGTPTWFGELGAIRSYDEGRDVVLDAGSCPGEWPPVDALRPAARVLLDAFAGQLEEHTPWNQWREASILLRGGVDLDAASTLLDSEGMGWAELVDNGVIPRRFEGLPDVERVRVYHLTPRGVSKRAAVAADRARRGLALEQCAVIGDACSDLACHDQVAWCFVVRNALDKDPVLASEVSRVAGARITERGHGLGFADAVEALLSE